jgi:hypothetical protein
MGEDGLYPFVRLIEASGKAYSEGERFVGAITAQRETECRNRELQRRPSNALPRDRSKSIEEFRSNPRYGGDDTRVDLAFAIYALSHGSSVDQVASAIQSRDLSHKGDEKRQNQYVDRTIAKARKVTESVYVR